MTSGLISCHILTLLKEITIEYGISFIEWRECFKREMGSHLFYDTNKKIEAYSTYKKYDAFEKAKQIASFLNIDILDATERESKWL